MGNTYNLPNQSKVEVPIKNRNANVNILKNAKVNIDNIVGSIMPQMIQDGMGTL